MLDWCDARRAERPRRRAGAAREGRRAVVEPLFDRELETGGDGGRRRRRVDGLRARAARHARGDRRAPVDALVESPLVAECLARLFANAVDAKDARDAAQAMALAATFCAAGASTPLVEGAGLPGRSAAAIGRIGSDAFWDEQLLTGAESELRLTRLDVNDVDDAVDHVQTVLFNRPVATAPPMRLLGEVERSAASPPIRAAPTRPRARRNAAREHPCWHECSVCFFCVPRRAHARVGRIALPPPTRPCFVLKAPTGMAMTVTGARARRGAQH